MALSDLRCRQTRPTTRLQKLSDGGGLQLWIHPTGARWWRLAYRFKGKQKLLALGAFPTISLADARQARDEARRLLAKSIDPLQAKKDKQQERLENTFRILAEEYASRIEQEGRATKTISKTKWLLGFAYPILGDHPIDEIDSPLVLKALRKVEARGRYETACRLRSMISRVFRYAIATGRGRSDPTTALQGALIRPKVTPRPAITEPKALGALLRAIDAFDGQPGTRVALELMALLFPRPGELRAAQWTEFDLDKGLWMIPGPRMKMRRPHRVPLARQAVAVLQRLRQITGENGPLFPSIRTAERPISDGTLNAALRRLGYTKDQMTPHGFRATASTLLNECGKWHPDAIERQLAHVENNDVRRAYARGEHWDERVKMMQWWANQLDALKNASPTALPPPDPRIVLQMDARAVFGWWNFSSTSSNIA
ncbi:MAG: tyrosine-type recombinase/integrase [Rhodospirillales bacterium]|nr:tyrosine-type recombinase/integrase [Rhodospirillales bacterium]